jgi:hypothetical protein
MYQWCSTRKKTILHPWENMIAAPWVVEIYYFSNFVNENWIGSVTCVTLILWKVMFGFHYLFIYQ